MIKLISQVIADFANGEIAQATNLFDTDLTLEQYLDKSFFKTASLIAASCRSAAVFSECDESVKQLMYDYGKHLGLAFQVRAAAARLCSPRVPVALGQAQAFNRSNPVRARLP